MPSAPDHWPVATCFHLRATQIYILLAQIGQVAVKFYCNFAYISKVISQKITLLKTVPYFCSNGISSI